MEQTKETMPPAGLIPAGWSRRLGPLISWSGWLYLAAVLAAWALLALADLWWPATFLMFSPRWLLILPGVFLAAPAAFLHRRALGPLLVGLVLVVGPIMGFCIPWQRIWSDPPPGLHLRLLTCNLHYAEEFPLELDDLLAEIRPDVVVLQEWRGPNESRELTREAWHVRKTHNQFLASVYPIRRDARIGKTSSRENGSVMQYELDTPAGAVTLFSLHLASPREGLRKVVREPGQGPEDVEGGSQLRWQQSENLAEHLAKATGPVLLAGDFNTPPESAIFRRLWGKYTDAFASAGWGWGYTFQGGRTLVRIDHILAGPGWRCDRCWVGADVGSPHRPVTADLTWPRD